MANFVLFSGRLSNDVSVKYTTNNKCVALFTLAVNREVKNADGKYEADFFNCVAWSKLAELAGNTLKKGSKVLVQGRMQNRNYEAKDGTKKYVTELIVNKIEFLDSKPKMQDMGKDVTKDLPFDDPQEVPF